MANTDFFPARPQANPTIYAYADNNPQYRGLLKVGYTIKTAKERVAEQYPTARPNEVPYTIVLDEPALKENGTSFTDHEVHRLLEKNGFYRLPDENGKKTEWFRCSVQDVMNAIQSIRLGRDLDLARTETFSMRPEQEEAVNKTAEYFSTC